MSLWCVYADVESNLHADVEADVASRVQQRLLAKLAAAGANGSLQHEMERWGLLHEAAIDELRHMASTPAREQPAALLSAAHTPIFFSKFIGLLFVRLSHNLLLESYVSRLAHLEKQHPRCHALVMDALFMYKAGQTDSRRARLSAAIRSARGRGACSTCQASIAEGRGLLNTGNPNASRAQLRLLLQQSRQQADGYKAAGQRCSRRLSAAVAFLLGTAVVSAAAGVIIEHSSCESSLLRYSAISLVVLLITTVLGSICACAHVEQQVRSQSASGDY